MSDKTRFGKILSSAKNHPFFAGLMLFSVVIIGFANFTSALDDLYSLYEKRFGNSSDKLKDGIRDQVGKLMHTLENTKARKLKINAIHDFFKEHNLDKSLLVSGEGSRLDELNSRIFQKLINDFGVIMLDFDGFYGRILFLRRDSNSLDLVEDMIGFVRKLTHVGNVDATPQEIVIARYKSASGTGFLLESEAIFAIDDGNVYLSLRKPVYEYVSGWGVFDDDLTEFKVHHEFFIKDNVYEIHGVGLVYASDEADNIKAVRKLEREVYRWEKNSKQFNQIRGRISEGRGTLSNIYADYANISGRGEWFTQPNEIRPYLDLIYQDLDKDSTVIFPE